MSTSKKSVVRRALPFCALILLLALIARIDASLKSSPILGYHPAGTTWVAHSDDLGGFWRGLEASSALGRIREEGFNPFGAPVLAARKATGIRPTPSRWRLWLGARFVAARSGQATGICVKPGILLHSASLLHRALAGEADGGLFKWRGLYYGWRNGFLVASDSAAYVKATLDASAQTVALSEKSGGVHVTALGPPGFSLHVSGEEGFPVEGTLQATFTKREAPLTLARSRETDSLLSISGSDPGELWTLVLEIAENLPGGKLLVALLHEMKNSAPEDWFGGELEFALEVEGFDTTALLPVPEVLLVTRTRRDAAPLRPPEGAVAYEWGNGAPGWVVPWFGEKLALAGCEQAPIRYVASQEPILARRFGTARLGGATEADVTLALDWAAFAKTAEAFLLHAAAHELVPRMNRADVERQLIPYVQALAQFGQMTLAGDAHQTTLHFKGFLAVPSPEEGTP